MKSSGKKSVKKKQGGVPEPRIRTCGNCRHFEILDEGYEIGRIEDTKFMESRCHILGWSVKEHYNFTSTMEKVREIKRPKDCGHWEYFLDNEDRRLGDRSKKKRLKAKENE